MNRVALWLIVLYRGVSFLFPSWCLYTPSCSEYALEAFTRYCFIKAFWLTIKRLARCNPLCHGGFDPIQ
ncbi:MAG: membrane protein insertion efficiency factor YidD [Candidatus Omnitrophota bacterium]|nr:membrane protein insertion efficiency factor YidD [Candidatus Omnitrophota bacterium]